LEKRNLTTIAIGYLKFISKEKVEGGKDCLGKKIRAVPLQRKGSLRV